jgi:hypothetical protein
METTVLRAAGGKTEDVDIATAAGLAEHLAVLDARVHPGESLAPLRRLVDEAAGAIDVVVVTATDVVADPNFRRALADAQFDDIHLATVDRSGAFELQLQTRRGRKLLKQAEFKLDEIFAPSPKPAAKSTDKLVDDSRRDLPAISRVSPFPLRLSCQVDTERSWYIKDWGVLSYTRDGRLLHWKKPNFGACQIGEGLPEGGLHWCATRMQQKDDGTGLVAVIGKLSRCGLRALHVHLDGRAGCACRVVSLESQIDQPKHVFVHQGTVFVADAHCLNAIHANTGALLATHSLTGLTHHRSRFYQFRNGNSIQWQAVGFDGTSIGFVTLMEERAGLSQVAMLFECGDFEGPRAMFHRGVLFNPATKQTETIDHDLVRGPIEILGISRDGARIAYKQNTLPNERVVDTRTRLAKQAYGASPWTLEPEVFATAKPINLRHRFTTIGVDAEGRLILVSRRGAHWPLENDKTTGAIRLAAAPVATTLRLLYPFERFDVEGISYTLWLGKFADGSTAVLDSRGLLHLRSSDETIPEMTIVLVEAGGACWFSTGMGCGNGYHFDDEMLVAGAGEARRIFERFVERLR